MNPRVLVIGSEGNIGRPLVNALRACDYDVTETDRQPGSRDNYTVVDILAPLDLMRVFDAFQPEVVYLLAAMVSRVTCEAAPSLTYSTNLAGVANVAVMCRKYGAKLIFLSSSEVYGPGDMDENRLPTPNNRYGLTKWLGEQIINYERSQELAAVIVRPTMLYSEDETVGDHRSAITRFAYHLAHDEPITVHRNSARSWMHMDDGVEALVRCAQLPSGSLLNIGHPDVVDTEWVAFEIAARLGAPTDLIHFADLPEGMTLVKAPFLNYQREWLDFLPIIDLEEGLDRVCEKYLRGEDPRCEI